MIGGILRPGWSSIPIWRNVKSGIYCHQRRSLTLTSAKQEHSEHNENQKTTVTLLNREMGDMISVDGISQYGFHLNTGVMVVGPMAVFPRTVLGWNVATVEDITPASLALFVLLDPRLDCLVIGTGDHGTTVNRDVIAFLRKKRIGFEILPTEQAAATFNFMNMERRCVAGAMLPPVDVRLMDRDRERLEKAQRRALIDSA